MKAIQKMLLPLLEPTILIIDVFSTNLKLTKKTLLIEIFKKYKKTPEIIISKSYRKVLKTEFQNINLMSKTYNNTCGICPEQLTERNKTKPYFQIFSFSYKKNTALRK